MSFVDFYYFYLENKDKINMPAELIGKHPPNMEALKRWRDKIAALEDETQQKGVYLLFADFLTKKLPLRYITFTAYKTQIQAVANEIYKTLLEGNYKKIIFVIEGEIIKSNTWVSLLFLEEFLKLEGFVERFVHNSRFATGMKIDEASNISIFNATEPQNDTTTTDIMNLLTKEKTMFLHFDDMSYSGFQIGDSIARIWYDANKNFGLAPGKQGTASAVGAGAENSAYTFDYYIATPYISTSAVDHLKRDRVITAGVKFFKSTKIYPTFWRELVDYYDKLKPSRKQPYGDENIIVNAIHDLCSGEAFHLSSLKQPTNENYYTGKASEWRKHEQFYEEHEDIVKGIFAFRCNGRKVLIYFDHKLADDISTFQKVLYFGSYPVNNDKPCEAESLITGCQPAQELQSWMNQTGINSCRNYIESKGAKESNLDQRYICPPTFYKQIDYTAYGNQLDTSIAFEENIFRSQKIYSTNSNERKQAKQRFIDIKNEAHKEFLQQGEALTQKTVSGGRRMTRKRKQRNKWKSRKH